MATFPPGTVTLDYNASVPMADSTRLDDGTRAGCPSVPDLDLTGTPKT